MGWGRDAGGSAGFALVKEQLETWRSSKHKGSGRIPEELWEAAALERVSFKESRGFQEH